MKKYSKKRYKANPIERRTVEQCLQSGVACIQTESEKTAKYVKTRLRVILTESGVTSEIIVGQRDIFAVIWMPSKFPSLRMNDDIYTFAKQEGNRFHCTYGLKDDRNYNLDKAVVEAKFLSRFKDAPVGESAIVPQALQLAEKAFKGGRRTQEKLDEIRERFSNKPDESE